MKSESGLLKLYTRLQNAAMRASLARDKFERMLDKAKENEDNWAAMCELTDTAPDADVGDWMS